MPLRPLRPRPVTVPIGTDFRLLEVNPNRLYFTCWRTLGANTSGLRPGPGMTGDGILPMTGQVHWLIHDASYPGLVQGEWYVDATVVTEFWIVEVLSFPYSEGE